MTGFYRRNCIDNYSGPELFLLCLRGVSSTRKSFWGSHLAAPLFWATFTSLHNCAVSFRERVFGSSLGQGRFLKIRGNADDRVDKGRSGANAKGGGHSGLQIEMLRIDADGCESGQYAASPAADSGSNQAFQPQFDSCDVHVLHAPWIAANLRRMGHRLGYNPRRACQQQKLSAPRLAIFASWCGLFRQRNGISLDVVPHRGWRGLGSRRCAHVSKIPSRKVGTGDIKSD
jgi:hypothetical protein